MVTVKMKNGKVSDHFELGEFLSTRKENSISLPK